jgi:hypothetical protein
VLLAQVADGVEVAFDDLGVVAVDLDEEHGAGVLVGQRLVQVLAAGLEGEPVHELDAGGDDAGGQDDGHDVDGLAGGGEEDEQVGGGLGWATSLMIAWVTMPRVPSEPMTSCLRS